MVINYPKFDYHASAERMDHSKLLIVITFGALRTCRVNLLEMVDMNSNSGSLGHIPHALSKLFFGI